MMEKQDDQESSNITLYDLRARKEALILTVNIVLICLILNITAPPTASFEYIYKTNNAYHLVKIF